MKQSLQAEVTISQISVILLVTQELQGAEMACQTNRALMITILSSFKD